MAKTDVAKFFAAVYDDKKLAGALHYALATTAPDAVVEIAKNKGYDFSSAELNEIISGSSGGKVSDEALAGVSGGALGFTSLSTRALSTSLWSKFNFTGVKDSAFGLTIPGPSFVLVSSSVERGESEVEAAADPSAPSATDLYDGLTG